MAIHCVVGTIYVSRMTDSKVLAARKLLASGTPLHEAAQNLGGQVPTLSRWVPASSRDAMSCDRRWTILRDAHRMNAEPADAKA